MERLGASVMPKDSILDEILNKEKDSISITEENGILQPVMEELDMISDDNIKSFVKSILIRADSFCITNFFKLLQKI